MAKTVRKPRNLTLKLDSVGLGPELEFEAYEYAYNKGADGRINVRTKGTLERGHSLNREKPNIKIWIETDDTWYGMSYSQLKRLSRWADQAAEWVKKVRVQNGYSVED